MTADRKTQTLESQWGRPPLTVGAEIPTVMLRFKLGRTHIGAPMKEVLEEVSRAILEAPVQFTEEQTRETLAAARWLHEENGAEYARVMSGRF